MTQPAEVTSVWDWNRLNEALTELRRRSKKVHAHIDGFREARETAKAKKTEAEVRDSQQWKALDAAVAEHDPQPYDTDHNPDTATHSPDTATEVEP